MSQIPVTDAANNLGVTSSRVRQLCREHRIGTKLGSRFRVLNDLDMRKLTKLVSEARVGRPPKKSKNRA